jgi:hypothetical protein
MGDRRPESRGSSRRCSQRNAIAKHGSLRNACPGLGSATDVQTRWSRGVPPTLTHHTPLFRSSHPPMREASTKRPPQTGREGGRGRSRTHVR